MNAVKFWEIDYIWKGPTRMHFLSNIFSRPIIIRIQYNPGLFPVVSHIFTTAILYPNFLPGTCLIHLSSLPDIFQFYSWVLFQNPFQFHHIHPCLNQLSFVPEQFQDTSQIISRYSLIFRSCIPNRSLLSPISIYLLQFIYRCD